MVGSLWKAGDGTFHGAVDTWQWSGGGTFHSAGALSRGRFSLRYRAPRLDGLLYLGA